MPSKAKKSSTSQAIRAPQVSHAPKTSSVNVQRSGEAVNGHLAPSHSDLELRTGDTTESAGEPTTAPTVNRKKQKRREKEAAKKLAEQQIATHYSQDPENQTDQVPVVRQGRGPAKGYFTEATDYMNDGFHDSLVEPDDAFYSGDEDGNYAHDYLDETDNAWLNSSKRKKGPRSRTSYTQPNLDSPRTQSGIGRSPLPTLSNAAIRSAHKMSNDPIWNTSTQAERENIKQFWLELGEEERRSLVKVEKEAVLKKMKEQQKHSCSCSVCGRKRTAIEEELEVLYDAYYEELEQFANHDNELPNGAQVMPPPRSYRPLQGRVHPMAGSYPVSGRIRELGEDGEELDDDDEYDDEDDEEPYSDEDYDDDLPTGPPDFFQFGNSLTVKDGILTVADDLLKNDGKHFIDMMEQLAERRMQREEEIHYPAPPLAHQSLRQGHNHPPIDDDDDYDDEEDDEEYDSQEDDDYEGDEMDSMTEEQRMEEGRRMFQIFAARMFEQRVLTAYREKVAAERQKKLLEELDEESRLDTQREAKKARDAAKKKEKKARQKAAKEEEKAKKEAEKAAQEAAIKEAEIKKAEEQRKRKEEQRKKREAERKAAEEEKQRKDAEKLRRAQEERERQAEQDRKTREAKEREKKKREESRKKERDEREAKEKEARDKRLKEEKDRKVQEEHSRKQRDEAQRIEKETKGRQDPGPRTQPIALPPGLHPVSRPTQIQSPHLQVAAPVVASTVPTPARHRQSSQVSQPSHSSSPTSQQTSGDAPQSSVSSTSAAIPTTPAVGQPTKMHVQQPTLHHPQPSAPRSPLSNVGRGAQYPYHLNGMPGLGMSNSSLGPGVVPEMAPPLAQHRGMPSGGQQRFAPNGISYPPGFGGPRSFPPSQQPLPFQQPPPPNMTLPTVQPGQAINTAMHTRLPSGSENNHHQQVPISRPGPIARPSSATPDKQKPNSLTSDAEINNITAQLGSKALLDDSDEAIPGKLDNRAGFAPVGPPGSGRIPFASQFSEPKHSNFAMTNSGWNGFGGMQGAGWPTPVSRPSPGWPQQPFGALGNGSIPGRPHAPRPIAVRLMLVHACRRLSAMIGNQGEGYHPVAAVLQQLEQQKMPGEPPVSMDEMLAICDTEGNVQNGGGSFEVIRDGNGHQLVKYIEDTLSGPARGSVGDIGSPLPHHSPAAPFGSIGQGFGHPGRSF